MRKSYFLLIFLALLFVCGKGYAQMQGINASSERYARNLQTLGEFVKVENIDDMSILTLCKTAGSSVFVKTKMGTNYMEVGAPVNYSFRFYDFRILDDYIYFCGTYTGNSGFIAWAKLDDIFNNGQFYYELLSTVNIVYNLEVFKNPMDEYPKVAALGYNTSNQMYSFIDYNIWNNTGTYDVYERPFKLQNLTQTDKYVAVVCSRPMPPYKNFGIIRHDKANISNYQGQVFGFDNNGIATGDIFGRLPELNKPGYLIEWIEDSPNVMVATCIDQVKSPHFGSSSCPIALFNIDLDNLSLFSTQVIPNFGKPYVKDMVYIPYDNTMHLIVNGQFGNTYSNVPSNDWTYTDFVHRIEVWNTNNYYSEILLPNNNTISEDILNSITKYEKYFYIMGGRLSNNNELYWFDRKIDVLSGQCYKKYEIKVAFDQPQPLGNVTYFPNPIPSNVNIETFFSYQDMYITTCLD